VPINHLPGTSDLARFSRADNAFSFIEDLVYSGGRFVSAGEGIDTNHEGWELRVKVMELHNSTTIRELGRGVRRGQLGRVLDDGSAGNFPFGYESYQGSAPDGQAQRKIGGQPGHPKHEREPFPPGAINDGSFEHRIDLCPRCGHGLEPASWSEPRVIQQVDINEVLLSIQEHRGHPAWYPCCQKLYEAPLPVGIERGGLVGPKLTTLIAYLKGFAMLRSRPSGSSSAMSSV